MAGPRSVLSLKTVQCNRCCLFWLVAMLRKACHDRVTDLRIVHSFMLFSRLLIAEVKSTVRVLEERRHCLGASHTNRLRALIGKGFHLTSEIK